ncbi:MAG: 2-dehydropantoate 2-reductase [Rhodobacteraceae bacterium]|nr:MAG: 2-dehydropantoate 2-reductase [Paracoccaceae bacterium]
MPDGDRDGAPSVPEGSLDDGPGRSARRRPGHQPDQGDRAPRGAEGPGRGDADAWRSGHQPGHAPGQCLDLAARAALRRWPRRGAPPPGGADRAEEIHPGTDVTRIVVAGAGSIGCFVGGALAEAGQDVALLGRARVMDAIRAHGLHLGDLDGSRALATPGHLSEDPAILSQAGLVLVTVKSAATTGMARLIAGHAPPDAPVISLQNGIGNAGDLARHLPGRDVRAGMVAFNVVPLGDGVFQRATSGEILIASGPGELARRLSTPRLAWAEVRDMAPVQWGKLVINLTNAVNALSGLPIRAMLQDRAWRLLIADQMAEALAVLGQAGIALWSNTPVPLRFVPGLLRLPTPIFTRVAARMLVIDPQARASMAYDLAAGRPTEIDRLQGEILALARDQGRDLPVMQAITRAVKRAEMQGPSIPSLTPGAIRAG